MSSLPSVDFEVRAEEDRRRLHRSVIELRSHLKDSLDIKSVARNHLNAACGFAAIVGVLAGYAITGIFVPEPRAAGEIRCRLSSARRT